MEFKISFIRNALTKRFANEQGAAIIELAITAGLLVTLLLAFLGIHRIIQLDDQRMQAQMALNALSNSQLLDFEPTGAITVSSTYTLQDEMERIEEELQGNLGDYIERGGTENVATCVYSYEIETTPDPSAQDEKSCLANLRSTLTYSGAKGNCGSCSALDFKDEATSLYDYSCTSPQYVFVAIMYRDDEGDSSCEKSFLGSRTVRTGERLPFTQGN